MAENQPTCTPPEEWRPVLGHEGAYEVSNHGRVRSLDRTVKYKDGRTRQYKGRILRHGLDGSGYPQVSTSGTMKKVHKLVLEAFLAPREGNEECRHIDGNPTNNLLENLKWGTRSENTNDQVAHGTHTWARKTHCPRGHQLEEPNLQPSELRLGKRRCRACTRARDVARRQGIKADSYIQQVADQKYNLIMGE